MKVGHKLRTLRIARNIKPVEIAIKLDISESTYRRYERDESDPTLSILYKIAIIYGIKVSDLLEDNITITLSKFNESFNKLK